MVFQCGQQVTPRSPDVDWTFYTDACNLDPNSVLPEYKKVYTILSIYEDLKIGQTVDGLVLAMNATFLTIDSAAAYCGCGKAKGWAAVCFRPVRSVERGMERLRGLLLPTAPSLVPEIERDRRKTVKERTPL